MRSLCQTRQYPTSCCTTDHSGRLPTTSPTLAFTAGFIFEPTRTQELAWAGLSAEQSTRTTCVLCTIMTTMMKLSDQVENHSALVSCSPVIVRSKLPEGETA